MCVDPLDRLLRVQDGVITRRQALRHLSPMALRHRVESGCWRRAYRGVFVAHTGSVTHNQRRWIAVLAAGADHWHGVCLGGLSALLVWGLSLDESDIHVLVPVGRRANAVAGAVIHRTRLLPDPVRNGRYPPVSLAGRSLVDAVRWARSDNEARLMIAASFQQRLVTLTEVDREVAMIPNANRRALLLSTARDCAGGSHSLGELELLAICRRYRLPTPSRQVLRVDRQGRRRFLDAAFDPWRVAVEVDGAHHMLVAHMWDDAVRSNALELDGYVVLRYPAFALRNKADRIAAEIRQALINAGWSG
jgi:very-short-patch-repair endonuclease